MEIPSIFSSVNINLVVPVFIVFALMRIKAVYNVALRLISGLRFFTQRRFAIISKAPKENPTPSDIIEKSIAQLNLTMIELDDSMPTKYVLQTQLFYDMFEVLVNLGLGCFLAYLWSISYHCAVPTAMSSCWVVLLTLALVGFCFQCLLQILMMTGWRAKETKFAIIIGFIVFLVSLVQFFTEFAYLDHNTVTAIAVHTNALLVQISPDLTAINLVVMLPLVQVGLSIAFALMACGLVIPALRYSQALDTLNFGARSTLVSSSEKGLLWFDFLLPLIVGILFSPAPQLIYAFTYPDSSTTNTQCTGTTEGTCSADATNVGFFDNTLMTAQLLMGGLMLVVRMLCMKKHLQCFLDTVVRVVSAHLMAANAGQNTDHSALLPRVKACTDYLMAAATQYLAVPLFAFACIILMHKSSPVGTGLCYTAYEAANMDKTALLSTISTAIQYNSSAVAFETASKPYFVNILHAAAGAQMMGNNRSGSTPSEVISTFALKLSEIYALPAIAAVVLCKVIVCTQCLLWFFLNFASLLAWRFRPAIIVGGDGN